MASDVLCGSSLSHTIRGNNRKLAYAYTSGKKMLKRNNCSVNSLRIFSVPKEVSGVNLFMMKQLLST